jgi:hypothetical protein
MQATVSCIVDVLQAPFAALGPGRLPPADLAGAKPVSGHGTMPR